MFLYLRPLRSIIITIYYYYYCVSISISIYYYLLCILLSPPTGLGPTQYSKTRNSADPAPAALRALGAAPTPTPR